MVSNWEVLKIMHFISKVDNILLYLFWTNSHGSYNTFLFFQIDRPHLWGSLILIGSYIHTYGPGLFFLTSHAFYPIITYIPKRRQQVPMKCCMVSCSRIPYRFQWKEGYKPGNIGLRTYCQYVRSTISPVLMPVSLKADVVHYLHLKINKCSSNMKQCEALHLTLRLAHP